MFFLLFALWLIFNGRISWDVVLLGIAISALLTLFGQKVCGWSVKHDLFFLRHAGQLLAYAGCLFIEILEANFAAIRIILSPRKVKAVRPQLFFFDAGLKSDAAKTVLANSITITPGTYTLGIYDSTFAVHALDGSFATDAESPMVRRLQTLETDAEKENIL